jgi:hypothetical protein
MKAIRDLLQEADPLRVESEPSAADRSFRRQTIVTAAATAALPATESRSRIPVYLSVMLIIIVAFAVGSRLWSPSISKVQAAVRFEVRLAEQNPAPGLKKVKVTGWGSLFLHDEVIVTNSDIAQANVIPHGSQFWVGITLTPAGAKKMHAATESHIGKLMAILIDGEVVSAPRVMQPLDESPVINGDITKEEAEKIVAGIIIR